MLISILMLLPHSHNFSRLQGISIMEYQATHSGSFELAVDLVGWLGAADPAADSRLNSADSELASGLAVGTWLNHLRLILPTGSRFLVQSGGR